MHFSSGRCRGNWSYPLRAQAMAVPSTVGRHASHEDCFPDLRRRVDCVGPGIPTTCQRNQCGRPLRYSRRLEYNRYVPATNAPRGLRDEPDASESWLVRIFHSSDDGMDMLVGEAKKPCSSTRSIPRSKSLNPQETSSWPTRNSAAFVIPANCAELPRGVTSDAGSTVVSLRWAKRAARLASRRLHNHSEVAVPCRA